MLTFASPRWVFAVVSLAAWFLFPPSAASQPALDISDVLGKSESLGPSSRRTGLAISEIMYHPAPRSDGKEIEFVEIYNSNPFFEDISGYRLSGAIDYTFPANTKILSRSFVIIAKAPADLQSVYGLGVVYGPFTNKLENGSGVVRLRNKLGAVLLEATYSGEPPYPAAADGAGHSLALARPTYRERNAKAWAASTLVGGSPGVAEPASSNPYRTVVINEFLAHTDDPDLDYIELYNYSNLSVDLSGCYLSDEAATNKFKISAGTAIAAKGFAVFNQTQLGFALSSGGETIYLRSPSADRVIDAVRFSGQANGVATGRYPDGAAGFHELTAKTPGLANAPLLIRDIVINEIMYNPISGDNDDQYVELYNRGASSVDLSDWRLEDGVEFKFPPSTLLAPNAYLVVAKNATRLRTNYANLNLGNTLGNFDGQLSHGGERIALTMPDTVASTNSSGVVVTNKIHIIADEVTYRTGGRWGQWSDGGGSSLELIDPHSDHRLASNWADSDEASKSAWTTVQWTGLLDQGRNTANALHLFLQGAGECLVDDVEVIAAGGPNLVANPNFESGTGGWFFQGTHDASSWETGAGYNSTRSLHVRATGRGDTGANRIRTALPADINQGQTATLRARVRWLKGNPEILLRLYGNWLEAAGNILTARNLGTPGARNSRAVSNAGPAIYDVTHSPALPAANQAVTIEAKVHDPDGIASLVVNYRVDPSATFSAVNMMNNGAGLFSATIPGQPAGTMVAFSIQAVDGTGASSIFPNDSPARECLIRFGESQPTSTFGTYHLWFTQTTQTRWANREKNSNKPLDATFVYGNERVVYNIGTLYSGSPWHTPGYTSPLGNNCDYVAIFPDDDQMLGATDFVLATVGNLDNDGSAQREQAAFWMLGQLGVQNNYRRYVNVYVNGTKRARIYEDAQQPGSDVIDEWFPNGTNGDLHKIEDWFEFDESGDVRAFNVDATLQNFTTTGGGKKLARYRWNWRKRAVSDSANAYTNLFQLVDAMNVTSGPALTQQIEAIVDVEEWARVICIQHVVGNWDSYGYGRGKNMYAYKPENGKWNLLCWDIDFVLGSGGDSAQTDMFSRINDSTITKFLNHPPFRRAYFRAMEEAVNGPLLAGTIDPLLDAKYVALAANNASPSDPSAIKSWIADRRQYLITNHINSVAASFAITSNNGNSFSTNKNSVTLSGTAPVGVKTIQVNGVDFPLTWQTVTGWSLNVALASGANALVVKGYDSRGNAVPSAEKTISINYTGAIEQPQNFLAINEIMYNPVAPDASFVEIYNRSANTAFDLSSWRLDGADFSFAGGTIILAGAYLVMVNDTAAFATAYGSSIPIAGVFYGRLENSGETLKLVKPGTTPPEDVVINEVTYGSAPPWPVLANGFGSSLQLIDAAQDNNRVMNWAAVQPVGGGGGTQNHIAITHTWKFNQSSNDLGTAWKERTYNDGAWPSGAGLLYVETADLPAPKSTPLTLGPPTFYFRTHFNLSGDPANVTLNLNTVLDDGAIVYLNGMEIFRLGMAAGTTAFSTFANRTTGDAAYEGPFSLPSTGLLQGDNVLAVEVHQVNATSSDLVFGLTLDSVTTGATAYSPGVANSVRTTLPAFPQLWLNEVEPNNVSGLQDRFGDHDPWGELYNSGSTAINLTGYYLSDNYTNLQRWPFPAGFTMNPGQRFVVWLDGEAGESSGTELHTNFRIPPVNGSIVLVNTSGGAATVVDYLNYELMTANHSYGAYPDGTPAKRMKFFNATPTAANNNAYPPLPIFINEWMADNARTIADPADGDFEDWFELFNAGPVAVDLSGFTLTDTLSIPDLWKIPNGTVIGPGEHLLVWADGEPGQNGFNGQLHGDLRLNQTGEAIALFNPLGVLVDSVTFGPQTSDVSQGRWPDGNTGSFVSMTTPTPASQNVIGTSANNAPALSAIGNKTVNEGSTLSFAATATDLDAGQLLTFTLDPGAPSGAGINPNSGVFTWTPTEQQGPGSFTVTVRVTDNGSPALSDAKTFIVTANEVNSPPTLALISDKSVTSGGTLTFTAAASDPDVPAQTLAFSLDENAPVGPSVHPSTGVFSWAPTPAQEGKSFSITMIVTDNGTPPLNAAQTFRVTTAARNTSPVLAAITNKSIVQGNTLSFVATASDSDVPAQVLTFGLDAGAPAGAAIDPSSGAFAWTPDFAQGPGKFLITVFITDNGAPPLSDQKSFEVTVTAPAPLQIISVTASSTGTLLIRWSSLDQRAYRVQFSEDLAQGIWQNLGEPIIAGSPTTFAMDHVGSAQRFYRIVAE